MSWITRRKLQPEHLGRLIAGLRLLLLVLLLLLAAGLAFRPDRRDELRRADGLLAARRYYEAMAVYGQLSAQHSEWGEAALRVGVVRLLRGEHILAVRALYAAVDGGLRGERHDLALLYLGRALLASGDERRAALIWRQVPDASRYSPVALVLAGERALGLDDVTAAVALYQEALVPALPADWWRLATTRLALLRGATEGASALDALVPPPPGTASAAEPLLAPLLPRRVPDESQLTTILQSEPVDRAQLLGQLYLELELYDQAQAQFSQVPPSSPQGQAAATYQAYTLLRSGDQAAGLAALEAIVAAHPGDPRPRVLLALEYVAAKQFDQAQQMLTALQRLPGRSAQAQLAWASWRSAQQDYLGAATAYRQVLASAPRLERGGYALLVAHFHLDSGFGVCEGGLDAADLAERELPQSAEVLTVLAGSRLYCGDPGGAALAAQDALALESRADAAYYLAAALDAQGQTAAARQAYISAADLAPASVWRERAERALANL